MEFAGGYAWTLTGGTGGPRTGTAPADATGCTVSGLSDGDPYTFVVRGLCSAAGGSPSVSAPQVVAATVPSPPANKLEDGWKYQYVFRVNTGPHCALLTYNGRILGGVDPTTLELRVVGGSPDPLPPVCPAAPNKWLVPGIRIQDSGGVSVSITAAGAGAAVPLQIPHIPTRWPTFTRLPFKLAVTHYSGPPPVIQEDGKGVASANAWDPVFSEPGSAGTPGTWSNQQALNVAYAELAVMGFVAANCQRALWPVVETDCLTVPAPTGDWYGLCMDSLYFGVTGDPTVQGTSVPHLVKRSTYTDYEANRCYALAESYCQVAAEGTLGPSPFVDPPLLAFYKRLIQYNDACLYGHGALWNPTPVQLAMNVYGSKKPAEEWWYASGFVYPGAPDPLPPVGTLLALSPYNPKAVPSVVTGMPGDGTPGGAPGQAGFNCLERWFQYVAYLNQRLRVWMLDPDDPPTNVLGDNLSFAQVAAENVGQAVYYQISAVTTDGEGNGFPNITALPAADAPYVNLAIKVLWNYWVNQTATSLAGMTSPLPSWWDTSVFPPAAPEPRVNMPPAGAQFTLPCNISMTTPGLINGMTAGDVGSPDYDAVGAVFHEVYDTASAPFPYLGAGMAFGAITDPAGDADQGKPIQGAFFTPSYLAKLETQAALYGVHTVTGYWDNLPAKGPLVSGGGLVWTPSLSGDGAGGKLAPGAASSSSRGLAGTYNPAGSLTVMNSSAPPSTPLLQRSVDTNPWAKAGLVNTAPGWLVPPVNTGSPDQGDVYALGFALESSRYDLWNGMWASQLVAGTTAAVYYGQVTQRGGTNCVIDGARIWSDLSMGLKPFTASIVAGAITTPAAAAGNVFMLSNQAGQFVNCMGLAASHRVYPSASNPTPGAYTGPDAYRLGFSCPNSALPAKGDPFPGWLGMAGQYWGPYASQFTGQLQRWCLNQAFLGEGDLAFPVPTDASEDNFGVFADFDILVAAWQQAAEDLLSGELGGGAVWSTGGPGATAVPPQMGLYELGYVPLAWCAPTYTVVNPPGPP